MRDYYQALGVDVQASIQEIRRAFRRLARQCSPDVNFWDQTAAELFEEIREAFRILSDPKLRNQYDRQGRQGQRHGPADRVQGSHQGQPPKGHDLHYTVELSLEDAIRGMLAELEVVRKELCPPCAGTGAREGVSFGPCRSCHGTGQRRVVVGPVEVPQPCGDCGGGGRSVADPCPHCKGRGLIPHTESIQVRIPPGIDTGSELRVPGKGDVSPLGGVGGDLVLITKVRPHPFFERKGDNLYCEVPVTITEAALGARIQVPTPEGLAGLSLPPGTQSKQVFCLQGLGVPRLRGEGRGALYVTVMVAVPKKLDMRTEELLRALERLHSENPRREILGAYGGTGTRIPVQRA